MMARCERQKAKSKALACLRGHCDSNKGEIEARGSWWREIDELLLGTAMAAATAIWVLRRAMGQGEGRSGCGVLWRNPRRLMRQEGEGRNRSAEFNRAGNGG